MALIKCPNCGHNISDKAPQCPKCGFNAHQHSGSQPTLSSSHIHVSEEIKKNDDNRSLARYWMYISIGVGCVLLFVACIYVLNNNNRKDLDYGYVDSLKDDSDMVSISLDTITSASIKDNTTKKKDQTSYPQPLTQYFIVNVENGLVSFRNNENMAKVLKLLGFKTKVYDDINYESGGPLLKASRNGTTVTLTSNGEDLYCKIRFNSEEELSKFIESMEVSQWKRSGKYYSKGYSPSASIYAKIEGDIVTMISPFEMLPYDF